MLAMCRPPRRQFVAPGKLGIVKAAACREFPFGFGRQRLAGPSRIGLGIAIGDMHDGMIVEAT